MANPTPKGQLQPREGRANPHSREGRANPHRREGRANPHPEKGPCPREWTANPAPKGQLQPREGRADPKPEKEGPTATHRANPNPKGRPLSSFSPPTNINFKNIDFVCNYSSLTTTESWPTTSPRKKGQPRPEGATPTARRNRQSSPQEKEGPTPTRRAKTPTPRRKGQPRPEGPTPPRRGNFNPEKEGPTPNPYHNKQTKNAVKLQKTFKSLNPLLN